MEDSGKLRSRIRDVEKPFVVFLVGAFLGKSARLLQWLVFFLFFSSDYNLTLNGPLFLQSKLLKLLA